MIHTYCYVNIFIENVSNTQGPLISLMFPPHTHIYTKGNYAKLWMCYLNLLKSFCNIGVYQIIILYALNFNIVVC